MTLILVLAVLVCAGAVVFALARGLHAFANMKPAELDENGIPTSLATQNKMMFARVKWQAITILLLALLLIVSAGSR